MLSYPLTPSSNSPMLLSFYSWNLIIMSLSIKKKVKLNPFEIYIFVFQLEAQLKNEFPHCSMVFHESIPQIVSNDEDSLNLYHKTIKQRVTSYRVEVILDIDPNALPEKSIKTHKNGLDFKLFSPNDVTSQIELLEDRSAYSAAQAILGKIGKSKEYVVVICPIQNMTQVKKILLEGETKMTEINLDLPAKQVLVAWLMNLFNSSDHFGVKTTNVKNELWVEGPKRKCLQFKERIHEGLNKKYTLIFNADDEAVAERVKKLKFKYEVYLFSYKEVEQACEDIRNVYSLEEPSTRCQQIKEKKPFFLMVMCPHEFKEEVSDTLHKASEIPQQEPEPKKKQGKDQKVTVCSVSVPCKFFKEEALRKFFFSDKSIQFDRDIRFSKSKEDVKVELVCLQSVSKKKSQKFNDYFNHTKYSFVREVNEAMVDNLVATVSKHPANILSIEYVHGFSPYSYYEMRNNQDYEKGVIAMIGAKKVAQTSDNNRDFYCFIIKGLHFVVEDSETQLLKLIKDYERIAVELKEWRIRLHPLLHRNILNPKVRNFVEGNITKMFEPLSSDIKLVQMQTQQDEIICSVIILDSHLRKHDLDGLRNESSMLFNSLVVETIKYSYIDLPKVEQLCKEGLFVEQKETISMIGFNEVFNQANTLRHSLDNSLVQEYIHCPLYLMPLIKKELPSFAPKAQVTFSEDPLDLRIKIQGFKWNVDPLNQHIKSLMEQGSSDTRVSTVLIHKDAFSLLKESDVFARLSQEFKTKVDHKQLLYSKWIIKFDTNNQIVLTETEVPDNESAFRLFLNSTEFKEYCKMPLDSKIGLWYIDKTTKAILVDIKLDLGDVIQRVKEPISLFLVVSHLNMEDLKYLMTQYGTHRGLPKLNIHSSVSLGKCIQGLRKEENEVKERVYWGWIEGANMMEYANRTQRTIAFNENNNIKVFTLSQEELGISNQTFALDKSNLQLKHLGSGREFPVSVHPANKCYIINLLGVNYEILKRQYEEIRTSIGNEVSLCLALYKLDLSRMIQTNLFTQFERVIFRNVTSNTNPLNYIIEQTKHTDVEVSFYAHKNSSQELQQVKAQFKKELQALSKYEVRLEVDTSVMALSQLKKMCETKGVEFVSKEGGDKVASVILKSFDRITLKDIDHDYKIKEAESRIQVEKIKYPLHWTKQTEMIEKVLVDPASDEFKKINNRFAFAPIKNLFRIQNQYLWRKFSQEKKDIEEITKEEVKQMYLFHGTRSYNPENIYLDKEESFNINFSSDTNYFGRGIYFADQAKYSDNYHHPVPRAKQMLFSLVLVGTSQEMKYEGKSNDIKDTSYRDKLQRIKYESIKSHYSKSDIYIVYKSRRAYPEYLIEY